MPAVTGNAPRASRHAAVAYSSVIGIGGIEYDRTDGGKADTVLFLPKEGFGFSRDAKARFGPPKFSAAAFTVDSDAPVYQKIRMRYMSR